MMNDLLTDEETVVEEHESRNTILVKIQDTPEFKAKLEQINEITTLAVRVAQADIHQDYARGQANGMIQIVAILLGSTPKLLEVPNNSVVPHAQSDPMKSVYCNCAHNAYSHVGFSGHCGVPGCGCQEFDKAPTLEFEDALDEVSPGRGEAALPELSAEASDAS